ncbi:MAG: ribonuclease E inhibitor RraB [Micrococcales bacterium]
MWDFGKANELLLERRQGAGDSLTATHRVQHFCYFANQFMAQAAEAAFKAAGFETVLVTRTIKSQVLVMHFLKLTPEDINAACEDIAFIVKHYGGEYGGWDSPIVAQSA